eukprot:COSAG03_NODE_4376_length_1571_cov_47.345109_2_plen_174_part_01
MEGELCSRTAPAPSRLISDETRRICAISSSERKRGRRTADRRCAACGAGSPAPPGRVAVRCSASGVLPNSQPNKQRRCCICTGSRGTLRMRCAVRGANRARIAGGGGDGRVSVRGWRAPLRVAAAPAKTRSAYVRSSSARRVPPSPRGSAAPPPCQRACLWPLLRMPLKPPVIF